jgi:hypothetical protein
VVTATDAVRDILDERVGRGEIDTRRVSAAAMVLQAAFDERRPGQAKSRNV